MTRNLSMSRELILRPRQLPNNLFPYAEAVVTNFEADSYSQVKNSDVEEVIVEVLQICHFDMKNDSKSLKL